MNKTNIRHWHSSHNDWLRALDFYKDEIDILRERLNEVAGKNTAEDVKAQVEHFENQFTVQRANIEKLQGEISANVASIAKDSSENTGFVEGRLMETFKTNEESYNNEEKIINELRHSFNRFCADWM
jgi:phage-related tail protein